VTTQQFLLQFLETQRKSVGEYGDLLSRLAIVADDKCGLIIIDQELGNG
jgi:ferritin